MTDDQKTFLQVGHRVLRREADAVQMLAEGLDGSFSDAVELILKARGRVIVSGMGKSGHIGRKIAATFASTGTPAHFVHPAEASHGDLGMLAKGDVALVLSNSGETPELADIVAYTRRFQIPLIGVAGKAGSTLLREADVALLLPKVEEACEKGIVPTTSTTMTLALGDALAFEIEGLGDRGDDARSRRRRRILQRLLHRCLPVRIRALRAALAQPQRAVRERVGRLMGERVLVVGGGGREHALCWKIAQSPLVDEVLCAPGNAGTENVARNVPVGANDLDALVDLAQREAVGLVVVGPDDLQSVGRLQLDRCFELGYRQPQRPAAVPVGRVSENTDPGRGGVTDHDSANDSAVGTSTPGR